MKRLNFMLIAILVSFSSIAVAKPIRVLVIDTGFDFKNNKNVPICSNGNKDATGTGIQDVHGHGTHISEIIDQYAKGFVRSQQAPDASTFSTSGLNKDTPYCQMICKYYVEDKNPNIPSKNTSNFQACLEHAVSIKPDLVNISSGGVRSTPTEKQLIIKLLDMNIKIVTAAGNEGKSYLEQPYYPAMYDSRIVVVGNLSKPNSRALSSNWGAQVKVWEVGTNVLAAVPGNKYEKHTGTSQAAAVHTGKLIHSLVRLK